MRIFEKRHGGTRRVRPAVSGAVTAVLGLTLLTACDVQNPGRVQDEFLADPGAQQGLVTGSIRRLAELVTWQAYTTAMLSQEIFPGGQTGAGGHDVATQGGYVQPGSYGGYFSDAQQARYIAETAIERFTLVDAPDDILYQAYLWAGYAYRTLGENWCQAVLGGGSIEPGSVYFEAAVEDFTAALGLAASDDERYAALAGRASAYGWLGDWVAAASDAAAVPDDFELMLELDQTGGTDYHNWLYWANANSPYRAYTIWNTWYEGQYTATGDPRIAWTEDPEEPFANAALSGYGPVPWTNQLKYTSRDDDMRLSSGWEMRLIEAEAILQQGQPYAGAMTLINEVHTRNISDLDENPLPALTAADEGAAWTHLKRERALELWLEGRRMGDLRRWQSDGSGGTPGTPTPVDWGADISDLFNDHPRSYCFDIPDSERDANPNVPATGGGG